MSAPKVLTMALFTRRAEKNEPLDRGMAASCFLRPFSGCTLS
jgi:hypothetical protein